jgi:hypothetical protein
VFVQVYAGEFVRCLEVLKQSQSRSAVIVREDLLLLEPGKLQEQQVHETLFSPVEVVNAAEADARKGLKRLVAIIVHIHLPGDAPETQVVRDDERVNGIVLGQVRVNVLELLHLFRVEYMEGAIELSQKTVFAQGVHQSLSVDRGSLNAD